MKIHILYYKFFELDGSALTIGGIQSYIQNLAAILIKAGYDVAIYQESNAGHWTKEINGARVIGCHSKAVGHKPKHRSSYLLDRAVGEGWDYEGDLIIWGTDHIAIKSEKARALSIQHGIGFDGIWVDSRMAKLVERLKLQILYKFFQRWSSVRSFMRSEIQVCVDYNYLNWVRTMVPRACLENVHVIPNFTETNNQQALPRNGTELRVLFARRFSEERGSLLMIKIVKTLLSEYADLHFTIAGDGPYKNEIQSAFAGEERVQLMKFQQHESLEVHSRHHVAIVPTIWSEGTSLSLLEAMTSGCVPVVSNVGGMTNIVLDGYNGLMVNPNVAEFVAALSELYVNEPKRIDLQKAAKQTSDLAFSRDIWARKWLNVIKEVSK